MLDAAARVSNYQAQTGSTRLTPRQHRRIAKKSNAHKPEALAVREVKSEQRAEVRADRKRRLAELIGR